MPRDRLEWHFDLKALPNTYDASHDHTDTYSLPQMTAHAGDVWKSYGALFERIGHEFGVDPCALATYAMFESFDATTGNLKPSMLDVGGGMIACGITASQAQLWAGKQVPGTHRSFPRSVKATEHQLRHHPEDGARTLAAALRASYAANGQDLARALPKTAFPAWRDPAKREGAYGTQAQYVSRAYVLFRAFRAQESRERT